MKNLIKKIFALRSSHNSEKTNKTTENEAILDMNKIDVACFTETWLN